MIFQSIWENRKWIFFLIFSISLFLLSQINQRLKEKIIVEDDSIIQTHDFKSSDIAVSGDVSVSSNPTLTLTSQNSITILTLLNIVWLVEGWPVPDCPVLCYFDRNGNWPSKKEAVSNADAIFYYTIEETKIFYNKSKVNLIFTSESFNIYPDQELNMKNGVGIYFDASVNYHLETDKIVQNLKKEGRQFTHLTITYSPFMIESYYEEIVPFSKKDSKVPAALFVSNCNRVSSSRNEWIKEMMKYMSIDSFGKCYNNKRQEEKGCSQPHYEGKLCTIRQYKFYLAFENSVDESYVSEKYWHALKAGTVPVYLGAPNIAEFDPLYEEGPGGTSNQYWKPKSLIRATDFGTAKDLAKFLNNLAQNEAQYNKYLDWRYQKPTERFQKLVNMTLDFPQTSCRICQFVDQEKKKKAAKNLN